VVSAPMDHLCFFFYFIFFYFLSFGGEVYSTARQTGLAAGRRLEKKKKKKEDDPQPPATKLHPPHAKVTGGNVERTYHSASPAWRVTTPPAPTSTTPDGASKIFPSTVAVAASGVTFLTETILPR
jgi:hypothetical protein